MSPDDTSFTASASSAYLRGDKYCSQRSTGGIDARFTKKACIGHLEEVQDGRDQDGGSWVGNGRRKEEIPQSRCDVVLAEDEKVFEEMRSGMR